MDFVSNSASLFQQVFHLYRHISSSRNFSDTAGALSALIAVEYFRFESWVQASGLVTKDPASGEPIVHDDSLRRCILLAADANWATLDYRIVEETILGILSEVYRCLERLNKLRGKYAMDLTSGLLSSSTPSGQVLPGTAPSPASTPASTGLRSADTLFSIPRVIETLSRDTTIRQERSRAVSFFRKVNFGWSLSNDVSDRVKLEEALKTLKDLNDHLESIFPSSSRSENGVEVTKRLVSLKILSVATEPTELRSIGEAMATRAGHADLYQAIHTAAMIKARRLEGGVSPSELERVVLEMNMLFGLQGPSQAKSTRTLCKLQSDGSTVLLEGARYPDSLPDADIKVLNERIATLALLLKLAGHPYFKSLPSCHGYIRYSHTKFGLVYSLPDSADPSREPISLYSLLPTTSRRNLETAGMTKRISRNTLPTLEERYRLAHALADGVLSLLGVTWVHKSLCSWNILLFRSRTRQGAIDFSRPLIVGFGVSRHEKPEEITIDTRDLDSPLRLWQHPDLRGSPHVRFQPKYDIYSLGLMLFEIAMWQDLPSFDRHGDLQTYVLNHSGVVAHRMGTTYRDAMMACLDDDFRWDEASVLRGGGMALVFVEDVVAKLLLCVEGV
ncbi:hypothetical protein LCI18_003485 [Fusarium solani-melongenae]|uniref:Uncharacterized protein n=1 Tax=Fusarium solani subsp. cucurbitae TaxID=2747967 RepID=A0ACD3YUC7_FUSSC|nr:hypothetical protein LCI18_003485 [Fusarium solani-melongenae]